MKETHRLRKSRHVLLLIASALCLAACGQKGDLYLPDETRAAPVAFEFHA